MAGKRHKHHLGKGHGSSLTSRPIRSDINITPLVDAVLVLLIIFMVVTPMLSRGKSVTLPETAHHEKKNDTGEQVVVTMTPDGKVWVGNDFADGDALTTAMRKALSGKSHEVHFKADASLEYGKVRETLERIHAAGAGRVALATDDKKGKESK